MTTAVLAPSPVLQFFTTNGTPLSGGLLTTYAAGTTTPIATYSNATGSVNSNPIVLSTNGTASVWLLGNVFYKFALTDSAGNNIPGYPVDNISISQLLTLFGGVDTGTANNYLVNFTASFTALANGIVLFFCPCQ